MDTNVIIRSALGTLGKRGASILEDADNRLYYSPANLWEIVIKQRTGKLAMPIEAGVIRRRLEERGCHELPIISRHTLATGALEPINKDPFDKLLVAQALVEDLTLITTDTLLAGYSAEVLLVE